MKLTTLEIKGFKSFGDKVLINFNEGVTAIVGPNGCGKSNVVDAIRWVLGEQSTRALRSDKMENVIFNGSRSRKASNLAEVSLTFDNTKNILPTEFSKVTITRKLFRSGDSEYRLNDVQCRLKDITDLFLDTGVGADSYSIIELKMIDEILNNKDNSRRTLFEEASGISKYKIRKKQTFNKLRDTEADLARVEDLLYEIEKNLRTLENQAKKTQRYYKIKEQYKELSTQLAAFRIHAFRSSLNELQKQETEQDDKRLHFQTETDKTEALLQEEKKSSLLKEKNLSVQQKATNEFVNSIRQYESEKKLKNEQLKFEQEKESRLQAELSNDKIWLERSHESILQIKSSVETENRELLSVETQLQKAQSALNKLKAEQLDAQQTLDEVNTANRSLQEETYKAEKEKDILSIQMETLDQELKRNSSDAMQKREELSEFSSSISSLQKRIAEQNTERSNAERFEEELQKNIAKTESEIQGLKDNIAKSNRSRDAKQNEYNLTKSLVDNLEGYPESIKFLRKNASWAKNAPLLSDLLFCKEEYRIPIENYLEPFMNYYVVESYAEAMQAINLLSSASKGRANFFVLEAFKDNFLPEKENEGPESTISALSIIDCDEKYKNLCRFLLNKVYLISGDEEKAIAETDAKDTILLSQSGKYARTKFSLSGGFTGLFEGKRIGRAKNLEVLQKEIKKLSLDLEKNTQRNDELAKQLEDLKASTKSAEITDIRAVINTFSNELLTLQTKEEQYNEFISNSETRREDIEAKLLEYSEKFNKINPLLADLNSQKEEAQERLLIAQRNHNSISEEVTTVSTDYNQTNIVFHQQKNKIAGLLKDLDYKESDAERYGGRIAKNSEELELTRKNINEILQTADHSDTDLLDMYEQKENLEKALAQSEEDYYQTKGTIGELENKIVELRRQKDQSDTITNEIREKKTQLKIELNSLKERLSVEFNIDIEDLLDQEDLPDAPEEELKQKSEKIKSQIETFGPINPMAMEAFSEMDDRYKFIIKEKNDLIEAKTSLLNTIQEIDETAKTQFMDAFNHIRDNFQRVFRSLFNEEDSCDLFLVNPDDPLESPIEIVARPKGKRPLSINQLSGGEKTLTATAILFSLYLLKPAPFCIFDEVDAPLDDTNIDKFNNIIREFSKESQFIVVSHNKRTIASTDVVYGVTMVEQGVSRVVPVDLRKFEDSAA